MEKYNLIKTLPEFLCKLLMVLPVLSFLIQKLSEFCKNIIRPKTCPSFYANYLCYYYGVQFKSWCSEFEILLNVFLFKKSPLELNTKFKKNENGK